MRRRHTPRKGGQIATLKYAFPQDPAIDMVFRNDMGTTQDGDYSRSEGLNLINFGFIYQTPDTLIRAIFAQDCDTSKPIDQALAALNGVAPHSAFFNERGLLVTRSSWDTDALRLMFQPRSEPGGHGIADRDFFALSALGRVWIPYIGYGGGYTGDNSARSSVVRVDDKGPSIVAAKFVEYNDGDLFTCGVGDAKIPYAKQPAHDADGTVEDYTFNHNRLKPGPEAWADMPWGELCQWYTSEHDHEYWKDSHPMERAFRTAALARGKSPYALIIDDIQEDESPHAYTWRVALAPDMTISVNGNDAILADPTNNKRLLVRLVDAKGTPAVAENTIKWTGYFNREASQELLDITTTAPAPDFKVLLVPYLDGTALPKTSYQGGAITVEMANGQTDRIDCAVDPSGRTVLKFNRLSEGKL